MNPAVGAKEDVPNFLLCLLTPIDVAARKRLLLIHCGRCSPMRRFSAAVLDELLMDCLHASPTMQGPRPRSWRSGRARGSGERAHCDPADYERAGVAASACAELPGGTWERAFSCSQWTE
jgi:hypothetical protein